MAGSAILFLIDRKNMTINPTTSPENNIADAFIKKKKWYKKWWALALIVFIIYFTATSLLIIYNSSGKDQNSTDDILTSKNYVDEKIIFQNISEEPQIGTINAKVRIVEFADFQCPYCQQIFSTVREIIAKYNQQIYFVFKDFPISDIHPDAKLAAQAAQCANEQGKFWLMHDKLFINQNDLSLANLQRLGKEIGLNAKNFNSCLNTNKYLKEVEQDYAEGQSLGVKGTPTFFINGYRISGVIPADLFIGIIEKGLSE